jgi:hypothetical protein
VLRETNKVRGRPKIVRKNKSEKAACIFSRILFRWPFEIRLFAFGMLKKMGVAFTKSKYYFYMENLLLRFENLFEHFLLGPILEKRSCGRYIST